MTAPAAIPKTQAIPDFDSLHSTRGDNTDPASHGRPFRGFTDLFA